VIVASVSCIYGLGSPDAYRDMTVSIRKGRRSSATSCCALTTDPVPARDFEFDRGSFRVRGDVIEVFPATRRTRRSASRCSGTRSRGSTRSTPHRRGPAELPEATHLPRECTTSRPRTACTSALDTIEEELDERLEELNEGKLLEAQRLLSSARSYDLEMLREVGFCPGIENYSRHLDGPRPGEPPFTLLDYFPATSWLMSSTRAT
jgi:excinuclease ABC subunit B